MQIQIQIPPNIRFGQTCVKNVFLRNPFVKGEHKKKGFIFQIRGENHPTLVLKTSLEQALAYKDVNKRYASYL